MEALKYYYEAYENRLLEDKEQGYANIIPTSAADHGEITNYIVSESLKAGKKVKVDMARKSLQINRKQCPKVFNVKDPLTDEIHAELTIDLVYKLPQFRELYEEISNAVGDLSTLKEGLKKNRAFYLVC